MSLVYLVEEVVTDDQVTYWLHHEYEEAVAHALTDGLRLLTGTLTKDGTGELLTVVDVESAP